ncbi:hypothetical protein BX667DRAFT_522366 [Coemansia mojavensis]|nr:hypothetical protein BX667DRAFT_522366 [Coemansia mojavensis]
MPASVAQHLPAFIIDQITLYEYTILAEHALLSRAQVAKEWFTKNICRAWRHATIPRIFKYADLCCKVYDGCSALERGVKAQKQLAESIVLLYSKLARVKFAYQDSFVNLYPDSVKILGFDIGLVNLSIQWRENNAAIAQFICANAPVIQILRIMYTAFDEFENIFIYNKKFILYPNAVQLELCKNHNNIKPSIVFQNSQLKKVSLCCNQLGINKLNNYCHVPYKSKLVDVALDSDTNFTTTSNLYNVFIPFTLSTVHNTLCDIIKLLTAFSEIRNLECSVSKVDAQVDSKKIRVLTKQMLCINKALRCKHYASYQDIGAAADAIFKLNAPINIAGMNNTLAPLPSFMLTNYYVCNEIKMYRIATMADCTVASWYARYFK